MKTKDTDILIERLGSPYIIDKNTYDFEYHDNDDECGPFGTWLLDHNIQFRDDDGVQFYIENKNNYPQEEEKTDYLTITVTKRMLGIGFFDEERSVCFNTDVDRIELQCIMDYLEKAPYIKYEGYIGDRKVIHGTYYYIEGNYMHGF